MIERKVAEAGNHRCCLNHKSDREAIAVFGHPFSFDGV